MNSHDLKISEDFEEPREDMKVEINALLWGHLPGWCTLAEAEQLSARFFGEIMSKWNRRGTPECRETVDEARP